MASPQNTTTPISPPGPSTALTPASNAPTDPISPPPTPASQPAPEPPSRSSTFEHKTSGAVPPVNPLIETSLPAINAAPVELDGQATESGAHEDKTEKKKVSPELGEEDEIAAEFLGEEGSHTVGVGRELREKRKTLLESRSKDPGVIVDLPREPTAEEVLAAKMGEGAVTPGIPVGADGVQEVGNKGEGEAKDR